MIKRILLVLLFLTFYSVDSQIRNEILILTDTIDHIFEKLPFDHFSDEDIKTIERLQKVRQQFQLKVEDDELVYIYKNEFKPRIKNEALQEIYQRKNIDKVKLFKETVHQTDQLEGLSLESYPLQSIFFDEITDDKHNINLINDLTSYIFNSKPLNIPLIENITHKIPKNQWYYNKVKEILVEYKSKYLLEYLAGFKNPDDVELIKSYGKDSYFAIQKFSSVEFLPFLESMAEKESSDYEYLSTVAKLCHHQRSGHLINTVFNVLKNSNYDTDLFKSYLSNNKCPIQ